MVNKTWVTLLTCFVGLIGALFAGLGTNTLDKVFNRDDGRQQEAPSGLLPDPAETPKSDVAPAEARSDRGAVDDVSGEDASASSSPVPEEPKELVTPDLLISVSDVRISLGKVSDNGGRFGTVTLNLAFTNQSSDPLRFIVHAYSGKRMQLVLADGSVLTVSNPSWPVCRSSDLRACAQRDASAFQNVVSGQTLNYTATFKGSIPNSGSKTAHDLTPARLNAQLQLLDSEERPHILPVQVSEIELN